jgi:hypothetical protein
LRGKYGSPVSFRNDLMNRLAALIGQTDSDPGQSSHASAQNQGHGNFRHSLPRPFFVHSSSGWWRLMNQIGELRLGKESIPQGLSPTSLADWMPRLKPWLTSGANATEKTMRETLHKPYTLTAI